MEVTEEQVRAWREMERRLEFINEQLGFMQELGEREMIRIDEAIRASDRRAERYLPILRRHGLLPEQRCRCRTR